MGTVMRYPDLYYSLLEKQSVWEVDFPGELVFVKLVLKKRFVSAIAKVLE